MKKKGKVFFAAACMVMAAGILPAPKAFAAETIKCEISSAKGVQGDDVDVTFGIKENPGAAFYQLELSYDEEALEPLVEDGSVVLVDYGLLGNDIQLPNPESNPLVITGGNMLATEDVTAVGDLFKISFKIKEDAKPGDYKIKVSGEIWNKDTESLDIAVEDASVTVACAHKKTHTDTQNATCTAEGKKEVICDICQEIVSTEVLEKLPHTLGEWEIVTPASCTEKGSEIQKCTICQQTVNTREIPASGHKKDEDSVKVVKEATCTEAGEITYLCAVCGEKMTEEIPALGHQKDEDSVKVTKEPTCTEAGEKTYVCTVCGEEITEEIPALGHKGEWKVVKEATETENGLKQEICSVCGEVLKEEVIPAVEKQTTGAQEDTTAQQKENNTEKDNEDKGSQSPITGDAAPVILLGIAAAMAAGVIIVQKRRNAR